MNVKYTVFKSRLKHSEQFEKENSAFLAEIDKRLQTKLAETDVNDYDCDLKLLFVQTGGSEGLFLASLDKLQPPFYLLTNGGNNSLAASMEILTYARLHGYDGEILHGDSDYVAQRIRELTLLNTIKHKLSNVTLGVVGDPSDWLISSVPDQKELKHKFNINLKYLPLADVEKGIETADTFRDSTKEQQKAEIVYDNLKNMAAKHKLSGLTIRCFDLLSSIKMTGCLALAKLNAEGIVATCEGDVAAMVSMCLVQTIFHQPSFQANPSRIDTANNEIIFAHCTVPLDMVESYRYDTHFESGIGIAIKGVMKKSPVTIFRLSSSLREYTVLQGEITENLDESNLCRTQIRVKCEDDVSVLLKNPCGNHHVIFYGHRKEQLEQALKLLIR